MWNFTWTVPQGAPTLVGRQGVSDDGSKGEGFRRGVGTCCAGVEGGWGGFLEKGTFFLPWGREALQAEGTGSSRKTGTQGPHLRRGKAKWSSSGARCLHLHSSGTTSKTGDLEQQGTSLLGAQFCHLGNGDPNTAHLGASLEDKEVTMHEPLRRAWHAATLL